jgi:hypothetical protein
VAQGCVFRSGFLEVLRQLTETYHVRVLKKPISFEQIFSKRGNCGPELADLDPDPSKEVQNMPIMKIMCQLQKEAYTRSEKCSRNANALAHYLYRFNSNSYLYFGHPEFLMRI